MRRIKLAEKTPVSLQCVAAADGRRRMETRLKLADALPGLGRPVAYYPKLAEVFGDSKRVLLFCQLFYWSKWAIRARAGGWFWKSLEDLCAETGLTMDELRAARSGLQADGVIETRYERAEHRLWFRVNLPKAEELWRAFVPPTDHLGNSQVPGGKPPNREVGKTRIDLNPEITPETTTKIALARARGSSDVENPQSQNEKNGRKTRRCTHDKCKELPVCRLAPEPGDDVDEWLATVDPQNLVP
jgi:hypothetical protein